MDVWNIVCGIATIASLMLTIWIYLTARDKLHVMAEKLRSARYGFLWIPRQLGQTKRRLQNSDIPADQKFSLLCEEIDALCDTMWIKRVPIDQHNDFTDKSAEEIVRILFCNRSMRTLISQEKIQSQECPTTDSKPTSG